MALDLLIRYFYWFVILSLNLIAFCYSFNFDGSSSSFSKFESWVPCHNGTITFEFKTHSSSALLFYTDGGRKTPDYFELKLINGIMHLTFMLNNERNMLSAGQNLNNNEWHSVDLIRDGRLTTLKVDEFSYTREDKNYSPEYVTFGDSNENYVFIGGLPLDYNQKLSELAHPQVVFEPRLQGSVRNLFYSNCGKAMTTPQMLDSEGLIVESDKCMNNNPCMNNGICVMRDHGVQCDCSGTSFTGEHCQIGKKCCNISSTLRGLTTIVMFIVCVIYRRPMVNRGEIVQIMLVILFLEVSTRYKYTIYSRIIPCSVHSSNIQDIIYIVILAKETTSIK